MDLPAPRPMPENLVLVGFMGSGKSSIGRHLAKRLGFQFLDTDRVIVDRAGVPIPELFAQRGEEAFRDLETAALGSLGHLTRCVIATGGGAVLRPGNRELLRGLGFVVRLTASEDVLFGRVSRNARRPLLQTEDPRETLRRLLNAREADYAAAADWTIDTSELTHAEAAAAIAAQARRAFLWQGAE